jgi:hypothetical protein
VGGAIKGLSDYMAQRKGEKVEESELGSGNLFATGLVAGGALAGVLVAILSVNEKVKHAMDSLSVEKLLEEKLGGGGFQLLGLACFLFMSWVLYRISRRPSEV